VRNRLHHGLFEADKSCLNSCLVDQMVQQGWKCNSFLVDDELIKKLIPRLAISNFYWYEIKSIQDISGNENAVRE